MSFEIILSYVIAAVPSVIAIIASIVCVCIMKKAQNLTLAQVIEKFEETRKVIIDAKEYEELKNQLVIAHAENRELKNKINQFLTKIDHIARPEEE